MDNKYFIYTFQIMIERCDQSNKATISQKQKKITTQTTNSLHDNLSITPVKKPEESFHNKSDAKDAHYFWDDEFSIND